MSHFYICLLVVQEEDLESEAGCLFIGKDLISHFQVSKGVF